MEASLKSTWWLFLVLYPCCFFFLLVLLFPLNVVSVDAYVLSSPVLTAQLDCSQLHLIGISFSVYQDKNALLLFSLR